MSRPVDIQDDIVIIPNGYTNTGSYNFTFTTTTGTYYIGNAYNNSNNTSSYGRLQLASSNSSTRKSEAYIELDKSGLSVIPNNATINSVTCYIRYAVSNTTYVTAFAAQLYANTAPKGSSVTTRSTTNSTSGGTRYQITAGSWTRTELDNIRLYLTATHNKSNNGAYVYLYGVDVTINYSLSGMEYEIVSTLATDKVDSISPAGQTWIFNGDSYQLDIYTDSSEGICVTDNGIDVTDQLVVVHPPAGTQTVTAIPTSFDSTNSVYDRTGGDNGNGIYSTNYIENGLTDHNSTTRCALYSVQGSGQISYMYYNFEGLNIPNNATITSVSCQFKGGTQGSSYYSAYTAQLCAGTTAKGNSTSVTGSNSSPSTVTINGGSNWTPQEVNNIKIKFQVTRGSSNTTTASTWSFFGATLTVTYTTPQTDYYRYTLSNVNADHTIFIEDSVIIPPDEDPTYTYYSVTVSSINADTSPGRGTVRYVEGSNETIYIYPSDPSVTLILDNGVDVSNLLVSHGGESPTYTVNTVSGASYGFNSSTNGYYISNNNGVASSAALCRVNFNLPVRCLVTFQYINYAEATYDFGVFSKVDTSLSTTAWNSTSNSGDTTTDAGLEQIRLNTSAANTSSVQTLTYEIEAGQHFIDVKFGKDQASDSYNDTLQFKIASITELEPNYYYTYSLSNIQQDHSLIFIFGDVTYYFVNSSGTGARLFPNGSMVQLPGDGYHLTIIPDDASYGITVTDNNVDVTNNVQRKEEQIVKDGVTITIVNYVYQLNNIAATHNIVATCFGSGGVYVKVSDSWVMVSKIYKKQNNAWVEQSDISNIFETGKIYINDSY